MDPSKKQATPQVYNLHGVLVHSGDVHGGHYCAFIKPEPGSKWYKFDDDRVIPVGPKEVYEDNFGGDSLSTFPMTRQARLYKRFTNAYMLVYVREDELDSVLAPVTESDIPEHLGRHLKEEQEEKERRAQEMAERHLYIPTRLITDAICEKNDGFDLADIESPNVPVMKMKRDMTWLDFKVGRQRIYFISLIAL